MCRAARPLTLVLPLALCPVAQAFDCAPVKPATGRKPSYGWTADRSRCEGFFERTVSQPFIELVSLTRGASLRSAEASAPPIQLQVQAPSATAWRLLVQPLRSGPYYRVDAPLRAGVASTWDPERMLAATGLRPQDLGFLALAQDEGRAAATGDVPTIAPVVLMGKPLEAPLPAGAAVAVVRVSVPVSSVSWRVYPEPGDDAAAAAAGASGADWTTVPDSALYAWQRLRVTVPLGSDSRPRRLEVQAVAAEDGRTLPLLKLRVVSATAPGPGHAATP